MMAGQYRSSILGNRRGMTLLELLIATALVAVAALVVAQAFAAGVRVWFRASQLAGNYSDAVLAIEQMQQDLRNTFPCRKSEFRGSETWVEIPALITQSGAEGVLEQPGLIRYEFDGAGQKLARVLAPCQVVEPGVPRREAIASGVRSIAFLYADQTGQAGERLEWVRAWDGRTNNPAAVKVLWRGQQGEEVFEFERTVALPGR